MSCNLLQNFCIYLHNYPPRPAGSCSGRLCPRIVAILTSGQARTRIRGRGSCRWFRWTVNTQPRSSISDHGTRSASPESWRESHNLKAPSPRCRGLSGLHTIHQICCKIVFEPVRKTLFSNKNQQDNNKASEICVWIFFNSIFMRSFTHL